MNSIHISHSHVSGPVNTGDMRINHAGNNASRTANQHDTLGTSTEYDVRAIFAVDLVGYRALLATSQPDAQRAIGALLDRLLSFARLKRADCYVQETGDGFICVFPPVRSLPDFALDLICGVPAACSRSLQGRRARFALGCGPTTRSELGVTGHSVVKTVDVLNSRVLRERTQRSAWQSPPIALVEPLWGWVAEAGHLGHLTTQGDFSIKTKDGSDVRFGVAGG